MVDKTPEKAWSELYREAVFESDRSRLLARIDEAHKAIQHRVRELWYSGAKESKERSALDAAARFLGVLRSVALRVDAEFP